MLFFIFADGKGLQVMLSFLEKIERDLPEQA
jgi:hypothetical protein